MNMHRHEFNEHGPWEDMHRGSFRAGRGMMEPAILSVLLDKPMHGYEIISTLEENSHGMWRPSAGSIYPTLQLLEEKGLLSSQEIDGKKVYNLTDEGQEAAAETKELNSPIRRFRQIEEWYQRHNARSARADKLRCPAGSRDR